MRHGDWSAGCGMRCTHGAYVSTSGSMLCVNAAFAHDSRGSNLLLQRCLKSILADFRCSLSRPSFWKRYLPTITAASLAWWSFRGSWVLFHSLAGSRSTSSIPQAEVARRTCALQIPVILAAAKNGSRVSRLACRSAIEWGLAWYLKRATIPVK